jgi:hypothetical protein
MAQPIGISFLGLLDQMTEVKFPFEDFTSRQGLHYDKYDDLIKQLINMAPKWKRPFISMKDDFHRVVERYYEQKYSLPARYLRGLNYHKPRNYNKKIFIKRIVKNYEEQLTRQVIINAITMATEKLTSYIEQIQPIPKTYINCEAEVHPEPKNN